MQLPVRNSGFINSLIAISENVSAANDRVEGRIRREGKVEKGKEVRRGNFYRLLPNTYTFIVDI